MPKPYSLDLRERVVRFVEDGHSRHAAAAHFKVSVSFVVNLMKAVRMRGSFEPKPSGGRRHAKLEPHRSFLLAQIIEKADITMPELAAELAATGEKADPASLSCWLIRAGYRFKKTLRASEQDCPDVKQAREEWTGVRQPKMRLEPHRLVFLDETGTTTKMTRPRGRCQKGRKLLSKAPFGHWKTQTFIAGLRCGALTAPFVIDAPMDRRIFETYVETQLAPTLQPGDIVILDNLPVHKSAAAETAIHAKGPGCCSCRPTAPTSIPSRWPALLRARAVRTIDALWRHRPNLRPLQPKRMSKLLRRSRIRIQMKVRRSRASTISSNCRGLKGANRPFAALQDRPCEQSGSAIKRSFDEPSYFPMLQVIRLLVLDGSAGIVTTLLIRVWWAVGGTSGVE
jgi:transposase